MKRGDRMFDVGRVAGELQHSFMTAVGDWRRAEPFIGHFLWEYSCHFPDRERTFESITARAPYYMGLNLLRIARNDYIGREYGGRLVRRARSCSEPPERSAPRSRPLTLVHEHPGGRLRRERHPGQDPDPDGMDQIFRSIAHFLTYQGIDLHRHQIRDLYFGTMKEQPQASSEEHPEFDAVAIWRSILKRTRPSSPAPCRPGNSSRCPVPGRDVPRHLPLPAPALPARARGPRRAPRAPPPGNRHRRPERVRPRRADKVGLLDYFDPIVVSGDHG